IAFLPPSPYQPYPMPHLAPAPPSRQHQHYYGQQHNRPYPPQQPQHNIVYDSQPQSPLSIPRSVSNRNNFEFDATSATSSQMAMSPQPTTQQNQQQNNQESSKLCDDKQLENIFDFKMDNIFSEDMLQQAEKIA